MKLIITIAAIALTAFAAFAEPIQPQNGILNEPTVVPVIVNGANAGNVTLPTGTKISITEQKNGKLKIRTAMGSTWVEETKVTISGSPAPAPAPIATEVKQAPPQPVQPVAQTQANTPGKKRVLFIRDSVNPTDPILVDTLKEKGVEVTVGSIQKETKQKNPPADLHLPEMNPEDVVKFDGVIISDARRILGENIYYKKPSEPIIKKVFSNGMKLIVVGELPASWKVVLKADGTPGYSIGNKFGRPYGMKVDSYRISYNIYAADRILGKPDANDSETRKFVEEKLVPEILKKL